MIRVLLNRQSFQYDVHSLVRAFYPEQEVQVICDAWEDRERTEAGRQKRTAAQAEPDAPIFLLRIFFRQENATSKIHVTLYEQEAIILQKTGACQENERKESKNELKRLLYRLLSEYTGKALPWGNLTGIRPTKIAMGLLHEGWKNTEIAAYMRETYYTSNEKTALAVAIANREHALLRDMKLCRSQLGTGIFHNGYSLYVGIPFCPSICLYCSFSSNPLALWRDKVDAYLDALCHEIENVAEMVPDRRPDTVYIGGGTPTTLEPIQLERLLNKLEECFCIDCLREFTVEAGRPDSITREKLAVLKKHGITRISINPQTMNQKTLDFIGRKHTVEQTRQAFYLARELGFDNINMDLIVGLPGENRPEVEHTMQELQELAPDSITVHSLAVKRAARLRLFKEEHRELTFENSSEIMNMTAAYTREAGLHPYYLYRQKNMAGNFENTGYAREGCEGLYNILIMEEVQTILALGAGAASKLVLPGNRISRIENVKDVRSYIERIDEMIERKRAGLHECDYSDI